MSEAVDGEGLHYNNEKLANEVATERFLANRRPVTLELFVNLYSAVSVQGL